MCRHENLPANQAQGPSRLRHLDVPLWVRQLDCCRQPVPTRSAPVCLSRSPVTLLPFMTAALHVSPSQTAQPSDRPSAAYTIVRDPVRLAVRPVIDSLSRPAETAGIRARAKVETQGQATSLPVPGTGLHPSSDRMQCQRDCFWALQTLCMLTLEISAERYTSRQAGICIPRDSGAGNSTYDAIDDAEAAVVRR